MKVTMPFACYSAPPGGGSLFDSMGRQAGPFSMAFPEKTTKWLALSLLIAGGLSILLKVRNLRLHQSCPLVES